MKRKELFIRMSSVFLGLFMFTAPLTAGASEADSAEVKSAPLTGVDATSGRKYFEGSKSFVNGGPACVTCHNVTNDKVIPGGLLAKDLTDVYDRLGEGITAWLDAPPFPAMVTSYKDHPLTEQERTALTAFFKQANEEKTEHELKSGSEIFFLGGGLGLIAILFLISLLWMKRKKQMVKKEIFDRQSKAWDAKH